MAAVAPVFAAQLNATAYFRNQKNLTKDGDYGLIALDINDSGTHYFANLAIWVGADGSESVTGKFQFADGKKWVDIVNVLSNFSITYNNSSSPATNTITLTDDKTNTLATITVNETSAYDGNKGKTFFFARA